MKGILSKAALLFSLFFLWNWSAKADHIVGSDITYTCGDTAGIYNIVFNFYRDCNGCYVLGQSPRCGTTENWNGVYKGIPAQQDVYAYILNVTALNDQVYEYSGTITLIR